MVLCGLFCDCVMAHLHWVQTQIQIPNLMATLYYAEHVHMAQS